MAGYGEILIDLHLLRSKEIDPAIAKFKGNGENRVENAIHKEGKVSVNKDQYFDRVSEETGSIKLVVTKFATNG